MLSSKDKETIKSFLRREFPNVSQARINVHVAGIDSTYKGRGIGHWTSSQWNIVREGFAEAERKLS